METLDAMAESLDRSGLVTGLVEVDAPEGVRCFTGHLRDDPSVSVSLVDEPALDEAIFDTELITEICVDASSWIAAAARALPGAPGDADGVGWGAELTLHGGSEWSVRFADVPEGGELGYLVAFDGRAVIDVDDLTDATMVDG